jgi:hypothetical protein
MGVSQVCVCRHNTVTFSSDSDGRVFLCQKAGITRSAITSQPSACCLLIHELNADC